MAASAPPPLPATGPWWCALLRGIGPGNPNMRNEKLRGVVEDLGFSEVASVISSGNVIFRAASDHTDRGLPEHDGGALGSAARAAAEARIQAALQDQLGIAGGTVLRSREELAALVASAPFGDREHARTSYLTVTFLKDPGAFADPAGAAVVDALGAPPSSAIQVVGVHGPAGAVLAVTDTTATGSPDVMAWLERRLGKDITTRTWRTVERILAKMP
ncbi:DUF1697 domain-containing protein [Nesterenkonia sp. CL21]|uniref:DUF1697 domain-containing protein n=1 Tax=Nesterenkonia sp. CL21 TaxID=3064894 RepID=UPI002879AFBE|nr:DUF1697 domain-containing protein [Nesterenkonia sp. CL21]MDS2173167.1 DUF1697 domain-containing protein [Nesterenkonia sp. CL21]